MQIHSEEYELIYLYVTITSKIKTYFKENCVKFEMFIWNKTLIYYFIT